MDLTHPDRRRFLLQLAAASVAGLAPLRALGQEGTDEPDVTDAAIQEASRLAGIEFTAEERELMREGVADHIKNLRGVRALQLQNEVPPAMRFRPDEGLGRRVSGPEKIRPAREADWGEPISGGEWQWYWSDLRTLRRMLDKKEITSVDLTKRFLDRLREVDEKLHCVITLTEDRALAEAARADEELAKNKARSPLHGIPYGAKDLLAARGTRTTWGAQPFRDQIIDDDADVVRRLGEAGAILIAKTSVGALAWGEVWFDATTRNPWDLEQGSSGSSAGSAAAVAAGGLPFALGTETLGSLVSPSTRCGVSSIRPTFGRVSRGGCMALTWSMDKIGPMARSVADCALVLDQIAGASPRDPDSVDRPLHWPSGGDVKKLRVGVVQSAFAEDRPQKPIDDAVLATLRAQGLSFIDVETPDFPVWDLMSILEVEAAAAFEELTLSNRDDELVRQIASAWPNVFRAAQLVPAVQYVQAQRARTELMRRYDGLFENIDVLLCPSFGGNVLGATNLTGHPTVVLPNGFTDEGHPTSICFTSALYREGDAAAVAQLYQRATDWHLKHPDL